MVSSETATRPPAGTTITMPTWSWPACNTGFECFVRVQTEPKNKTMLRERPVMKTARILSIAVVILPLAVSLAPSASGQEVPPEIRAFAVPKGGYSEIVFHGIAGPFQIQTRTNLDPTTPWIDMHDALVTEL